MTTPNFDILQLSIPQSIHILDVETQGKIFNYLSQLSLKEKKVFVIAHQHLGTSFDILRSNGYDSWIKKKHT